MWRKFKRKRFWFLLTIFINFLLIIKLRQQQWLNYSENYTSPIALSTEIERVRVSDVIALNEFIKQAVPTMTMTTKKNFYAYNQLLSDKIGAYRALPDTRDEACKARNYYLPQRQRLKVSIIIAFHNEARSTLMRTIMSVYRRTPAKYLHEIILLDDNSQDALLLSTLRHLAVPPFSHNFFYTNVTSKNLNTNKDVVKNVATNSRRQTSSSSSSTTNDENSNNKEFVVIKMQRNSRRLGLIESRNLGARLATGDYLIFLDSHCEVNVGWLEPLLYRVQELSYSKYKQGGNLSGAIAVSPVLDSINAKTLEYRASSQQLMGGFDWNLHFHWLRRERGSNRTASFDSYRLGSPFKSPVTAGGVFLISRSEFLKLQGFNSLLNIWGGESIEFSIKLWLCGGQIEIVPCSRIGHIFRKQHTFRFLNDDDGQTTYLRNSKIIAESWLDAHKHFFYALKPAARNLNVNISNLNELEMLKRKQKCQPFAWYLRNVFPQLKLPNDDFIAFGKLSTAERCLHILRPHQVLQNQKSTISSLPTSLAMSGPHVRLQMANCYHTDVTQWYLHRHNGHLHSSSGACLNVIRISMPSSATTATTKSSLSSASATAPASLMFKFLNQTLDMNLDIAATHFNVVLQYCHPTAKAQRWLRRGAQLIHEQTHLCLDNPLNDVVAVSQCRHEAPSQLFHFTMEMQQLWQL